MWFEAYIMKSGSCGSGLRWVEMGLGAMFVLIGFAVFLGVVYDIFTSRSISLGIGSFIGNIFGWIILVFIFVWMCRWIFFGGDRYMWHHRRGRSIGIARMRYARGEISKREFEQIVKDLQDHPGN